MKFPQFNIQKNSLAWLPAHGRFNAQSASPFPPSRNARRNKYGPKIASKGRVAWGGGTAVKTRRGYIHA